MILPTMPLRARPVAALVALALAAPPTATPHEPLPAAPVPRSVGWVRPVQPGPVVAPFDPPEQDWLAGHRGVDLAAAVGEVVRAPADGTVTFAGKVAGRGVLVITHDDGLRTSLEPVVATAARGANPACAGSCTSSTSAR